MGLLAIINRFRDTYFFGRVIAALWSFWYHSADADGLALSANIAVAVVVLLTTIYVRTPLEFSVSRHSW